MANESRFSKEDLFPDTIRLLGSDRCLFLSKFCLCDSKLFALHLSRHMGGDPAYLEAVTCFTNRHSLSPWLFSTRLMTKQSLGEGRMVLCKALGILSRKVWVQFNINKNCLYVGDRYKKPAFMLNAYVHYVI